MSISAHDDAAGDVTVAFDRRAVGRRRGERCDARLLSRGGSVEAEGFLEDVVEEGEGVDGAGGWKTVVVSIIGSVVIVPGIDDRRAKGEQFIAEAFL